MQSSLVSVLVIEAHPLMREALCSAIAHEAGLSIGGQAVDSVEALKMLQTLCPDLILLAIEQHGQDYQRELHLLRQARPGTPILALTDGEGLAQAALIAGAQAAITKSAPRAKLILALQKLWAARNYPLKL
jgi:DNA-binding NarL/FixJ family response regulator